MVATGKAETKGKLMNILCCSGGNDSVALLQYAKNNNFENVYVLYNNTGWASDAWPERMKDINRLCVMYGFRYAETKSEGFENMVRRKKGWPQCQRMQFCTEVLKIRPTKSWLSENDPDKKAIIFVGIRREESRKRSEHPSEIIFSDKYDGRLQRFPLVEHTEKDRDFLIDETGIDILLHSSMECFPCVCSNRSDLRALARDKKRINKIAKIEKEMGFTPNNKPRTMFRPYRHMNAIGIKEGVKWAIAERGQYKPEES